MANAFPAAVWETERATPISAAEQPWTNQKPPYSPPEGWWEESFSMRPNPSESRGHPCGAKQMLTLVSYDITEPKRLVKIAHHCEDYGVRIQYSVFECRLEAAVFDQFWNELLELINPATDRLVAFKICLSCAREVRSAGSQIHLGKVVAYVF